MSGPRSYLVLGFLGKYLWSLHDLRFLDLALEQEEGTLGAVESAKEGDHLGWH